jgi:hypothetical protein
MSGLQVARKELPRFQGQMAAHPHMTALSFRILMRIMRWYDGERGAFPSYATLARDCLCARRSAIRCVKQLADLGVLEVIPQFTGCGDRTSNLYKVCWPVSRPSNVVCLWKNR